MNFDAEATATITVTSSLEVQTPDAGGIGAQLPHLFHVCRRVWRYPHFKIDASLY
jgi:hypothetical protein